uniref:NADH-ubiquinone oxidoreductase chain 4 n=1 Tax=Cheiracanthium brevispinum TaxID=2773961 RepID=A0AA51Z0A5_9ARAC|nr:NADH dehydrogenase subunit 4 [Cheiracanthium brevispinum]WMX19914.1 NADH dehydrogenase subunit 4 [Cheiracanthium brevispinum]
MMKMMIMSIMSIILMKSLPMIMMTMFIMMMMMMFYMCNYSNINIINNMMLMDMISMIMLLLTIITMMLIMISSSKFKSITLTIMPMFLMLMSMFLMKNVMNFYILFELILIPILILITMQGMQSERLQASIYLMIYTITASLPLLVSIILMKINLSFTILNILMFKFNLIIFFLLAFLIKSPMYLFHLWLPKAHVEAPLEGSMVLAAILLKMGGYGLIRFMPICIKSMNKMNYWIISISLIGATATSMSCIRQQDMKALIAYSSVAHMGFVLMGIFSMNYNGLMGAIIMMIAHGLSSSALFFLVNDVYFKYHTRNLMLFKGLLIIFPNMVFWWSMFMAINISAPPTINTFSEILLMSSMLMWSNYTILLMFIMSLATASFSLSLFVNINHNNNSFMKYSYFNSNQKMYLSLFMHMIPLIIMITKLDLLMF